MKKYLLIACLSLFPILLMGQKNEKVVKSGNISDFKNRMYISTSTDPVALTTVKTSKSKEFEAKRLVTLNKKGKSLKAATEGSEEKLIDTTYTYPWNVDLQDWSEAPIARYINYYDIKHNLIHHSAFAWNYEKSDWQDSVQFFYKYNENGLLSEVLQQAWQSDGYENYSWVNIDHNVYIYNELGQETKFVYQYWNYFGENWDDMWLHEFTYDENGNNTLILENWWDGSEWTPGINFIYRYNESNQLTLSTGQVWDYESWEWSNAFQYTYEYDESGNNTSMLIQTWNIDEESWDNCQVEIMNYNSYNKIENYLFKLWDPYSFFWADVERGFYKYDSDGNNISIEGEYYDPYSDMWISSWKNICEYNSDKKQISNAYLYWDAGIESWIWGSVTKNAKLFLENNFAHSSTTSLQVFPNPSSDFVQLINNESIQQVNIYDIQGKRISFINNIESKSYRLNILNLKNGTYFLKIKELNGNIEIKKIIKR